MPRKSVSHHLLPESKQGQVTVIESPVFALIYPRIRFAMRSLRPDYQVHTGFVKLNR
jgi:hypothetical protein